MISLKNGALIRLLKMKPTDTFDITLDSRLGNAYSSSFYFETRAAILLDQVLDLIREDSTISLKERLSFQNLDRSLLLFMKSLIEQHLGTCCEAVAISVR